MQKYKHHGFTVTPTPFTRTLRNASVYSPYIRLNILTSHLRLKLVSQDIPSGPRANPVCKILERSAVLAILRVDSREFQESRLWTEIIAGRLRAPAQFGPRVPPARRVRRAPAYREGLSTSRFGRGDACALPRRPDVGVSHRKLAIWQRQGDRDQDGPLRARNPGKCHRERQR